MDCYTSLAGGYDSLTEDVQYEKRAAFLQKLLAKSTTRSIRYWIWPAAPVP